MDSFTRYLVRPTISYENAALVVVIFKDSLSIERNCKNRRATNYDGLTWSWIRTTRGAICCPVQPIWTYLSSSNYATKSDLSLNRINSGLSVLRYSSCTDDNAKTITSPAENAPFELPLRTVVFWPGKRFVSAGLIAAKIPSALSWSEKCEFTLRRASFPVVASWTPVPVSRFGKWGKRTQKICSWYSSRRVKTGIHF